MRILMLSDLYIPVIGGQERHVQTLSRTLAQRGHQVSIATLAHDGYPPLELDGSIRIHRIPGWNRALRPFYQSSERQFHPTVPDPGIMAGLRRIMDSERPDVVHGRGWILYSYLALQPRYPAKLVVTMHDHGLVCPRKVYMRHGRTCDGASYLKCVGCGVEQYGAAKSLLLTTGLTLSKRMHGRVDRYIAVSHSVADTCRPAAGRPPRPIDVIPTFVPDSVLQDNPSCPRPAFLPASDNYVLFVGELSAHKGIHTLLDAYTRFANLAPLVVIGTQHGGPPIEFPPNVTVARNVGHDDVMAAWKHSALGVVPSLWPEPLPQVAMEAMAQGKPVVASNVGGLPDLVLDGDTGILVPPGDADALGGAIGDLLIDPGRREAMGQRGRAHVRDFAVGVVADRIERLYAEVLGEPVASLA